MPRVARFDLSAAKARKPTQAAEAAPASKDDPAIKHMTVRLSPVAWRAIRQLAVELDTSSHSIILEGLNAMFEKHGKLPVA